MIYIFIGTLNKGLYSYIFTIFSECRCIERSRSSETIRKHFKNQCKSVQGLRTPVCNTVGKNLFGYAKCVQGITISLVIKLILFNFRKYVKIELKL